MPGIGLAIGLPLSKGPGVILGPELVVNGTFDLDIVPWIACRPGAGTVIYNGGFGQGELRAINIAGAYGSSSGPMTMVIGNTYRCTGDFSAGTQLDGTLFIRMENNSGMTGTSDLSVTSGIDGSFSVDIVATATTMYIGSISTGTGATKYHAIDNFSVREIWQAALGPELILDGAFLSPTSWQIKPGTPSDVTNGYGQIKTDGLGAFTYIQVDPITHLVIGKWYRFSYEVIDVTTAGGGLRINGPQVVLTDSTILGAHSQDFQQVNVTYWQPCRHAGVTDISIDNVSLREIL